MENTVKNIILKHSNNELRMLLIECDMIEDIIINSTEMPFVIHKSDMLQELHDHKLFGVKEMIEQEILRRVLNNNW